MQESQIKKYKGPKWLYEGVSKEEVEKAVTDKILDPIDTSIKKTIKPTGSKDVYSILNVPSKTDSENRDVKASRVEQEIKTEEDTGNEEDYPILTNIERRVASNLIGSGIPVASDISDTTPTILATFQKEPFDKESFFQVVLGFKDWKTASENTTAQEEYIAIGLALLLNGGNLENIENTEITNLTDSLKKSWAKSFSSTLNSLTERNDIFDPSKGYITFRGDTIFTYDSATGNVLRNNNKKDSVHSVINDAIKTSLFKFKNKDSWNPSDIYVIEKNYYKEFFRDWNGENGILTKLLKEQKDLPEEDKDSVFMGLNSFLIEKLKSRELIGISLKKTTGARISIENIEERDADYRSISFVPPAEGKKEEFYVPELRKFSKSDASRSGITFDCYVRNGKENERVTFNYRRFNKKLNQATLTLDLKNSTDSALAGKTPASLLTGFESSVLDNDSFSNSTEIINKEARKLFVDEDVSYLNRMEFILREFTLKEPVSRNTYKEITFDEWKKFISNPEIKMIVLKGVKDNNLNNQNEDKIEPEGEAFIKLRDWVSIINFLYVLAYCKVSGTLNDDLALLHDWTRKIGSRFAPYVLVH